MVRLYLFCNARFSPLEVNVFLTHLFTFISLLLQFLQLSSNLYLYLRWIWIQFPWIGLHSAPEVALRLREIRADEEKHRYDQKDKKGGKLGGTGSLGGLTGGGGGGSQTGTGGVGAGNSTATEPLVLEPIEENMMGGNYAAANADSAMLLRVWNVKKSDPTIPVFVKSANRRLAAIKPR
jgi:hypothetical protein